ERGGTYVSAGETGYGFSASTTPAIFGQVHATSSSSVTSPTKFGINISGGSGLNTGYACSGGVYQSSTSVTTTVTTVANTGCLGGCQDNGNSSFNYLSTNYFY